MHKEDQVNQIYKNFIKEKLYNGKEVNNEQIAKCKRIFDEVYSQSNAYGKMLLDSLRVNLNALMLYVEQELVSYTMNYIKNKENCTKKEQT